MVWDIESGTISKVYFMRLASLIYDAKFSLDSSFLVTASMDDTASLYDIETMTCGDCGGACILTFEGHKRGVNSAVCYPQ